MSIAVITRVAGRLFLPQAFSPFFFNFFITSPEWGSNMLLTVVVVVAIHVAFLFLVSSPERAWRL